MTRRHYSISASLRWYPQSWRDRYGDEMAALMEDTLGENRPTLSFRLSVAWAGLRERGHHTSPTERSRAGSLLVLCSWAAFVLAGISYAKLSEHFSRAMAPSTRALPQGAFNVATGAGVAGALLVITGAVVAVPALLRFVKEGGWPSVRPHIIRASIASALVVATLFPLSHWAHHLSDFQRNGGYGWYSLAVTGWALIVAGAVALWTAGGVACARRITLSPRVIGIEAGLAVVVTVAMVVVTGATVLWWASVADHAPWFLQGTAAGSPGSPFTPNLIVTMALMIPALCVAVYGSIRVLRSRSGIKVA
jgi:hypothetical protein